MQFREAQHGAKSAMKTTTAEGSGASRFERFVRSYGIERLARRLDLTRSAVQHWLRGSMSPHPANAFKIQDLAREGGVALSLDEIYEHFRLVGSDLYSVSRLSLQPAQPPADSIDRAMNAARIPGNSPSRHA